MKSILVILCIILPFLTACPSKTPEPNKLEESSNLSVTRETEWELAKEMIMAGKVETLIQSHNLTVILELKDGSRFTTVEPALDDIFKVVEQCGAKCSETMIVTE